MGQCLYGYMQASKRPLNEKLLSVADILKEAMLPDFLLEAMHDKPSLPKEMVKAAEDGDITAVATALAQGLPIDLPDRWPGETMLHHAAASGQLELVKFLLSKGATLEIGDQDRSTPLHFAAYHRGNAPVVAYLLQQGARTDIVDDEGLTPLDYARLSGDFEIEALLKSSPNSKNPL